MFHLTVVINFMKFCRKEDNLWIYYYVHWFLFLLNSYIIIKGTLAAKVIFTDCYKMTKTAQQYIKSPLMLETIYLTILLL